MARFLALALAACAVLGGCSIGNDRESGGVPPQIGVTADDDSASADLGFPFTATKNTTRVGGGDATSDVAGVAGAVWPATSDTTRPAAVVLVDKDNWQGAVAASVLAGDPLRAPLLLSDGDELPSVSADALERLDPPGSELADGAQVIRIGSTPPEPDGLETTTIDGGDVYELAAEIDRFHAAARGEPSGDVLIASCERAEYAMPPAALAGRSGDAVLLAKRGELTAPTVDALKRHEKPDVFILGPEAVIGPEVEDELEPLARRVRRIEGATPVQNAIALAKFQSGGFGWGAEVPGQNFTIASTSRPLENYLLDVQPGFEEDPSLSVYNHAWILGDEDTISVEQQARIDEITTLIPVELNQP